VGDTMLGLCLRRAIRIVYSWIFFASSYGCQKMGVIENCDDGTTGWFRDIQTEGGISFNTHCKPAEKKEFERAPLGSPLTWCEKNKDHLKPGEHVCMPDTITYMKNRIPVSGKHRPVWPVYGEYRYLPPQRWIHNLEHGGLVLLYHPCADVDAIEKVRSLVRGCLRRHVITPSRRLTPRRPFALVTWGCYINFGRAVVSQNTGQLIEWIQRNAIRTDGLQRAPEWDVWIDGDYDHLLKQKADIVSDPADSKICPKL